MEQEKTAIQEFAGRLRSELGNEMIKIILFGSRARGTATRESDFDILIVLKVCTWPLKKRISEIAAEIDLKYDIVISTVRYSKDLWQKPAVVESPFAASVLKEGIAL